MSSTARKVATNTAGQIILRSIDIILGVITLGLITRYLGQEGFGYYTTVTAFLSFFVILIDFGLYLTLLREIAARPASETQNITNTIFTMRVISSAALIALACVVVFFMPYDQPIKYGVLILSLGTLGVTLFSTLTAVFQLHLQMIKVAASMLLMRIIILIGTVYAMYVRGGLDVIFYVNSAGMALCFVFIWYLLRTLPQPIKLSLRFDTAYMRQVVAKTWPIALTTALNLIYFKADTLILSLFDSQETVGVYGASYRVLEIITTFPHMFMGLVLPIMTAAWVARNVDQVQRVFARSFTFFALLALPLITGTWVVGNELMSLIAGQAFAVSGDIIKVLIVATAAIFFGTLYTYMVLVVDRQRDMIKFFGLTAAGALIGYLIFIPLYSYWGAAWMTVASEVSIVLAGWLVVRKHIHLAIPWRNVTKIAIASILMASVTYLTQPYLPLVAVILISAGAYALFALVLKAVTVQDIRDLVTRHESP